MSDNLPSDPLAEINTVLGSWRSFALTSLQVSHGSLELLRRGLVGDVNDEQRSLLERTIHHIQDATACWLHLSHYLILHSSVDSIAWQALVLEDEIEQMLLRLQRTTPLQHIEVNLPSTLPLVRGTDWLQQAMINLLYPLDQSPKFHDRIPTITIWATDAATVGVQITTGALSYLDSMEELEPSRLYPGSCLQTAALILRHQASRIHIAVEPQRTVFDFTLPVWSEM